MRHGFWTFKGGKAMDITEITIRKVLGNTKRKAVASITLDGMFAVHDISIIEPEGRPAFISMPNRKLNNGQYVDIAHPTNHESRAMISNAILSAYEKLSRQD